jgi:hypothetical protein
MIGASMGISVWTVFDWWCGFICWAVALGLCVWGVVLLLRLDISGMSVLFLGLLSVVMLRHYHREESKARKVNPSL